mmetsp:Transcript_9457/g.28460  ORF Transcript_9457/g.28460 Transcript_9457/m.28460 type:complete len:365 (-) Transcript_9457:220-1314(-)|eukprot:CAMPEP_0206144942 /NCGR_PEP_ID=MMETSP1473-20131121/25920_1 /ASSEMBLY_ACC=CAM_ASM_001109 /TAXON_ID=1461547 /ORGANISM="Stichococcus sp, Strain RCC1054" /LENGTH=364 /DNA_ID=CAMNT_0053540969 /DNA_START=260 /DNA_END=1354 /DNA_ORIENTATION=+
MVAAPQLDVPEDLLRFCKKLRKVELHAHLNGSLRASTLSELAVAKGKDEAALKLISRGDKTLAECFSVFALIHEVTTEHDTITRLAREVVEDFAADRVVYLELRTTPKARPDCEMSKQSYTEAVLTGIDQALQAQAAKKDVPPQNRIDARLLLSIDRREGTEAALDTVRLAATLKDRGVVGIDLSGNPELGQWETWVPALDLARSEGLRVTLHAAEVYNATETAKMLEWKPDRLGHMCFLNDELERMFEASSIPVELCISSNVLTESVTAYDVHHFKDLHAAGRPVVLGTDDSGVFNTSLSREYAIAAHSFGLSRLQLMQLADAAVEHTFLSDTARQTLRDRLASGAGQCRRDAEAAQAAAATQ